MAQMLQRTPLHDAHVSLGARMVPFAGWEMPVQYAGVIDEHRAVRGDAGVFDVSHMGEFEVEGPRATELLQATLSNDLDRIETGQAQYTLLTNERGGILDDLIVYKLEPARYLLIVNASNREPDFRWLKDHELRGSDVRDVSDEYALLAVQGPRAIERLCLPEARAFTFAEGEIDGIPCMINRTGYTGEDGFEIFVPPAQADKVWLALLESGQSAEVIPCGLGARDTLRLEAGMRLHGNDIDETTTAVEADLNWIVGWKKDDFIGASALREQKASGPSRKIAGFEMLERGIGRHGYDAYIGDTKAGIVTSGTQTPHMKKAIGMAYLPTEHTAVGTEFDVDIRGRRTRARVVPMPFYKRQK